MDAGYRNNLDTVDVIKNYWRHMVLFSDSSTELSSIELALNLLKVKK